MHEVLPWIPLPQQKDDLNPLEKSKTSTKYKRFFNQRLTYTHLGIVLMHFHGLKLWNLVSF